MHVTTHKYLQLSEKAYLWIKSNLAFVLIILALVLFTSKSLYNIPVSIMAAIGLWGTIKSPHSVIMNPQVRIFFMLFLCLWVPLLISLPDAVNISHSSKTVFAYLRFLFMGIYLLQERNALFQSSKLTTSIFFVALFWVTDALIQYTAGVDLFGYPYEPGHITGMFYPRNTIAHILAALSPLYFEQIRIYSKKFDWSWILILPLLAVILLSGRRAAWVMLAISIFGYCIYLNKINRAKKGLIKKFAIITGACAVTLVLVVSTNKPLQDRIITTVGLFSLDYELIDIATARRLPIWETALAVFQENRFNGIGPRGFRHVYQQYSDKSNYWHETGVTHPHQMILEILAETGLVGLAGLLVFICLFSHYFINRHQFLILFPWCLCVFIVMFPLNTNMAFYGSFWSSVTWWFLILLVLNRDPAASSKKNATGHD